MSNTIKLKPVSQMGYVLEPGELVIDEAGRKLYLDKGDGPEAIPLDREPLPKTPRPKDPKAILIKGQDGRPTWAQLAAAGGGPPLADATGWIVPGNRPSFFTNTPLSVTNTNPATPFLGNVYVNETIIVRGLLIRPVAGADIQFTFGIRDANGDSLVEFTDSAYAGPLVVSTFLELTPGRYETYVWVESTLSFNVLGYREPWSTAELYTPHIVHMRLD